MSTFRKQAGNKGNMVYEQVLQKNFEIIETFMKKFHQIFIKQDQFQQHLKAFETKFDEYDDGFESFKQQQRLSLVLLEKKVNNMKSSVKESHRSSHRWSKINIPVFEQKESPQGGKNYTLLKLNSIEEPIIKQQAAKIHIEKKQTFQSNQSLGKDYNQIKEQIDGVKKQMAEIKDKLNFLSVYTSSIQTNQSAKAKMDLMKKELQQKLRNQLTQKIQKDMHLKMIETQNVLLQQVNNLTIKFSQELRGQIQTKQDKLQEELHNIHKIIFTKQHAALLQQKINKEFKQFAKQSISTQNVYQQLKKSINFFDKKVKSLENYIKKSLDNSNKDKQQNQDFKSFLKVNSPNKKASRSVQKIIKSQSQSIKSKNLSFSMFEENGLRQKSKQNMIKRSLNNSSVEDLSKGSLLTSQVSKQFMKNFGLNNSKKLVKGNFQSSKKTSVYLKHNEDQMNFDEKNIGKIGTNSPQNLELTY